MIIKILFLCVFNVPSYARTQSEQPVAKKIWRERCNRHDLALNDCNWCRCNNKRQYTCTARICGNVDMFGHFNDAIQDVDVGMEGHGYWRSSDIACQAGVHYQKGELLCVCTEDSKWPNPVCRDVFQVLHTVEPTKYTSAENQTCSPTKLYQIGCNVCYCLSTGKIDPSLCTQRNCSGEIVGTQKAVESKNGQLNEVYAACERAKNYQIGCKTCICLPNNRLLCDNCTAVDNVTVKEHPKRNTNNKNLCSNKSPGKRFKIDCNICYCDQKDIIYCTVFKCLGADTRVTLPETDFELVDTPIDDNDCVPSTKYKRNCNTCHCFKQDGIKYFGCSLNNCDKAKSASNGTTCVEGTKYEKNCLICECAKDKGEMKEFCTFNDKCKIEKRASKLSSLDSMHGYCEPLHTYDQGCNKCRCLTNGKTVACTSKICTSKPSRSKSMVVEFIPFIQKQNVCPKGHKYKVDCNLCHCMSNGNAICTTNPCKTK